MKKSTLTSVLAAAFSLAAIGSVQAAKEEMEKCQINGYNKSCKEVGLIKAGMADCKSATSSCAGENKAGDKEAWIYLPTGMCGKIQGGTVVK